MTKRLLGKVAIVTGGAGGIGESTAKLFVEHGAKVILADIEDEQGQAVCRKIGPPELISYVHCDVTSDAVAAAVSRYGKLDIMFANAAVPGGGSGLARISDADADDIRRILDVNVVGVFLCAKHAVRAMTANMNSPRGCIIITSSVASVSHGGVPHAYVASKHAVVGLMKNLCVELGEHAIRVNCVSPFGVASPMLVRAMGLAGKREAEEFVSGIANLKGEVVEARDVAEAVVFLASDEAKYVSGQNLVIDGGYSVNNISLREGIKKLLSS